MVESLEALAAKCDSASQALLACSDIASAAHHMGGVLLLVGSDLWSEQASEHSKCV
jgi:hypothetical protein